MIRIAKQVLPIIAFPIGIHNLLHICAGKAILPASTPCLLRLSKNQADQDRSSLSLKSEWKYKRITIKADGYKIDSVIVGRSSTFSNGRWLLASNGNAEFYEKKLLHKDDFKQILSTCNSNAIVFNYPGVGASSGLPNKQAMAKAYCAMLAFLESIGAKEIIGYGHSLGGGVQAEALKTYLLKKNIKYVFIKDRTFSSLSRLVSLMICPPFAGLIKLLGWEMDSAASSKTLEAPEIILQQTKGKNFLKSTNDLKNTDGVIDKNGSLASKLLREGVHENKHFLGITSDHNAPLDTTTIEHLSKIVNQALTAEPRP